MEAEDKMKKMIAGHEKMFVKAISNIKDAQTWYNKDYDKRGVGVMQCNIITK